MTSQCVLSSRGEMGIGTLILFISMLLVAAIGAGVLIQTTGSLQEKSLAVGSQAQDQIANSLLLVNVEGASETAGEVSEMEATLRLAAGSEAMNFDDMLLSMSTYDQYATYAFRGANAPITNSGEGYEVFVSTEYDGMAGTEKKRYANFVGQGGLMTDLGYDLDFDGLNDSITVCNNAFPWNPCTNPAYFCKYMYIDLTTDADIVVPLLNATGGIIDTSAGSAQVFANNKTPIGSYGYVSTTGVNTGACSVGPNKVTVFPKEGSLPDIDADGSTDYFVFNSTNIVFLLSEAGNIAVNLGGENVATGIANLNINSTIKNSTTIFGRIYLNGTTSRANVVDESVTVFFTPSTLNTGYYVAETLQSAKNHKAGTIRPGDIYKIHVETPGPVGEDELVRLKIIPRTGLPLSQEFLTPEVIATSQVALYP